MATHWTLGGQALDPQRQAAFWAAALGYVLEEGFEGPDVASIVDPDDVGPAMGWLRTETPTRTSNHQHIDIRVAGKGPWDAGRMVRRAELIRAKVPELEALGATSVREENYSDDEGREILGHVVMLDPEGNEFCVS
jgi:hypothetical protein